MHARLRKLKTRTDRLRHEDGMTLVEVLVSILLVGLIALSFLGLDAVGRTSADQRRVAQATQVAQQDQERLRGMSADQLATLNQTRTVTLDNNTYTVTSTGKYQSGTTGADSCASSASAADYARVISSVDWTANRRSPVVQSSIITPRVGGSLVVQAVDQGATGIAGATVTATGTDEDTQHVVRSGTTDSGGCVIFGSLPVGSYSVTTSLAGHVDSSGSATPTSTVTTTPGSSTNLTVRLGQPGRIYATFAGVTGNNPTGIASTAPSISWINPNMSTAGVSDPTSDTNSVLQTGQTVFPFITTGPTTFTNNYTVYAGRCADALPPAAYQSFATVPPGGTATSTTNGRVVVKMPVINVSATYNGSAIKPAAIRVYDECGDNWLESVHPNASKPSTGWLQFPGEPYGSYYVCADYRYNSFSYRRNYATVNNTSFTAANGNTVTVAIPASTTSLYQGRC
jgi:Tfp pilus assembly protein PilV